MFDGLVNLQKELTDAAADTSLPTERRELALELLDFLDTAPSSYVFEPDDYDPEIEVIVRDVKAWVEARARWYIPVSFENTIRHTPSPSISVQPSIVPPQTEIEEVF